MFMRIALLGTGRFATDFAPALVRAGHDVIFGSRHRREELLAGALVVSTAEAIARADVVVVALPGETALAFLPEFEEALHGKVVLDVSNAFTSDGDLRFPNSSVGEQLQDLLPSSLVVKSLNNMAGYIAGDPSALSETTVFLSGNDERAKRVVSDLLVSIGWSEAAQIDLGDITTSRAVEHLGLLFWALVRKYGTGEFNYRVVLADGVAGRL
ncbi:oxidoreductase [Curtobacterium sp. MCPF17_011]|nr:oxidoreductase [Curtobacterium sp. MCPF17_011]